MIVFKMKILNYNLKGSYSVEYIPEDSKCTPMKLDIAINPNEITNKDQVLNLLRSSSPQEQWSRELGNSTGNLNLLTSLINTTHNVTESSISPVNNSTTRFVSARPNLSQVIITDPTIAETITQPTFTQRASLGSNIEEIATGSEQLRIKLKLIIQEVLMEMAEATV